VKNVNFSPYAGHRSGRCGLRKKIVRYGILISLTVLIAVFWHRHVDIRQCQLHLSNTPVSKSPQNSSNQQPVQPDSSGKGEQKTVIHPQPAPPLKGEEDRTSLKEEENKSAPLHPNQLSSESVQENAASEKVFSEADKIDRTKTSAQVDKEDKGAGREYYIKVYSSVVREEAEKTAGYLTRMKYSPQIVREAGFTVMRNVYVYPDALGVQETVDRLTADGFSVYLQEGQEGTENQYLIRTGSCYYLESAKSLLKSLKHKGYSGNIVQEKTAVKFYSVFLGTYPDFEAALEEQKKLNLRGFPTAVVTSGIPASIE
jgi:hypothetical protein